MQDSGYGLPGIPLLGTWVNKPSAVRWTSYKPHGDNPSRRYAEGWQRGGGPPPLRVHSATYVLYSSSNELCLVVLSQEWL